MPITLYMMPLSPPARAVLLTAEALGVKIQTEIVNLSKQDHLKPEFIKVSRIIVTNISRKFILIFFTKVKSSTHHSGTGR